MNNVDPNRIIDALVNQRNSAMDQLAVAQAKLAVLEPAWDDAEALKARINELEVADAPVVD